ncbi:hypothetical protein BJF84_13465 [Rhodococcus sp. CUA-806]|nr:hypothetical protein BJF84_13465 [Rhodococcus sp. CUA-806]
MPVDAAPTDAGNIVLDTSGPDVVANVLRKTQVAGARAAGQQLYESHFASCRNAATFRKVYR